MIRRLKKIILSAVAIFLFTQCALEPDIVIEDFESFPLLGWTIEGEAFANGTAEGTLENQQEVSGFKGRFLANSFHGGDNTTGIMTSPKFTIERDYINFLIGGGTHRELYIELIIDGNSEYLTSSIEESETLHWYSWDVKRFRGSQAFIRIVDNRVGGWGHILIDHIVQSNNSKKIIVSNCNISFKISSKYLLLPIEDAAAESQVYLEIDGKAVSPLYHIRIAQTQVDYWLPMNVEEFIGKTLLFNFRCARKNDIGYKLIKQSDVFEFEFDEKFRPVYHFTPPHGWKNDPNGLVYHEGEYHLFYQHNPYGARWANMHWGHAVSRDLRNWEHLPVALMPDSLGTIFSGSAVVDKNNTAGFGENVIVAIYTSAGEHQTQCLAYSSDNGRTFTKYENNPVLTDPVLVDFRDPKVFWHEDSRKWVMALATGQTVTFFGSQNLKEWEKLSEFGENIGAHGGAWECPDLFPLTYNGQVKWVLLVSLFGSPNDASATQYFIGSFDGKTFKEDRLPYPLWLDHGRDNYAGVTWNNIPAEDGRRLFIGWMSNLVYGQFVPTVHFKSASTLPRELKLAHNGNHLVVANPPAREVLEMRQEATVIPSFKTSQPYVIESLFNESVNNGAYELEMTVKANDNFSFILSNKKGEELAYHFDLKAGRLNIDRTKSGITDFNPRFAAPIIIAPLAMKNAYKINFYIDRASSEIFIDNGILVSTNLIFPNEPYDIITFKAESEISVENINIYKIKL